MKRFATLGAVAAVIAAGASVAPAEAGQPPAGPLSSTPLSTVRSAAPAPTTTATADPDFSPRERAAAIRAARKDAGATARALGLGTGQRLIVRDVAADVDGARHIRYDRTLDGLPVIGGDLIVHEGRRGDTRSTDYASGHKLKLRSTNARHPAPSADSTLVVYAFDHRPVLAWATTVRGVERDGTPIDKVVYSNARTGGQLGQASLIHEADGTGHSLYSGTVPLTTTLSGSTYQLIDGTRGNSAIYDANNSTSTARGTLFTDADNVWGNGTESSRQSAAVDAAYGAANTWDFFKSTFGRNGIRNDGVAAYSRVHYGGNYENAFWSDSCFCMTYGDGDTTFKPLVSLDVAGHEMSHGVTSFTAGLVYSGESGGLNEATSDIFGTMVEFTANNAEDAGDYYIGEEIAQDGTYLRRMDNPSADGASRNCWSSSIGSIDVHYSSGVGNHFFYLLAEGSGSKTIGGRPHSSTTCNGTAVTGIGKDAAARIWYRALTTYMTSSTKYTGARDASIKAARDLYGAGSSQCQATIAAWNAVSVPLGSENCTAPPPPPTGNLLLNPGFESGTASWSASSAVIGSGSSYGPRTGSWNAWLNGYGTTHTDTLSQNVTVPAASSATLTFYLKVTSSETTTTTVYDRLRIQVVSGGTTSTLRTYSNLNKGTAYVLRSVDVSAFVGKTVTFKFLGTEDSSLATSFRIDDTSLTLA
ncbi:MAG: M4 family metallopeptidase [Nocardioidaceae bacterium]